MLRENITQKSYEGAVLPALTAEEVYRLSAADYMIQALYTVWIRPFLDPDGTGIFQVRDLMMKQSNIYRDVSRDEIMDNLIILEDFGLVKYMQSDRPWSFKLFCPYATGERRR